MSTFKYKPAKVKHLTNVETLDTLHRKHVGNFDVRRGSLAEMKHQLVVIRDSLERLSLDQFDDPTQYMKKRSELKDEINKINTEIYDIENNVSELEYYSKINDILFDYYHDQDTIYNSNDDNQNNNENIEPEKTTNTDNIKNGHFDVIHMFSTDEHKFTDLTESNIHSGSDSESNSNKQFSIKVKLNLNYDDGKEKLRELQLLSQQKRKPKKATRRRMRKHDTNDTINILDFFCGDANTIANTNNAIAFAANTDNIKEQIPEVNNSKIEYIVSNKASLFNNYMKIINNTTLNKDLRINRLRLCTNCGIEKTTLQSEGICVCIKCGEAESIIVESEIPSHKDTVVEKTHYPYKRINHLVEYCTF